MKSRRSNIAVALLLSGLAGWLLFESGKLRFGTMRLPQTAFFPSILAALLLVLSLVLLFQALSQTAEINDSAKIEAQGWGRIGATLATLVGFAILLDYLGFIVSTFLLMVLLLRAIEPQKWPRVIVIALVTALGAYVLFGWLLAIPLPAGSFSF